MNKELLGSIVGLLESNCNIITKNKKTIDKMHKEIQFLKEENAKLHEWRLMVEGRMIDNWGPEDGQ